MTLLLAFPGTPVEFWETADDRRIATALDLLERTRPNGR